MTASIDAPNRRAAEELTRPRNRKRVGRQPDERHAAENEAEAEERREGVLVRRELRQQARKEGGHLRVPEVAEQTLPERGAGARAAAAVAVRSDPASDRGSQRQANGRQARRGRRRRASFTARKAGSEAASSAAIPAAVANVQTACPLETPIAVKTPARRVPRSEFRIVSAVSGPGVTITIAETAEKGSELAGHGSPVSQTTPVRPPCETSGHRDRDRRRANANRDLG